MTEPTASEHRRPARAEELSECGGEAEMTAEPQIITFYAYKGGIGRTMALANMAWILASNGLRVLAVDWDLETPGLHHYLRPFLRDRRLEATTGVIELIRDYASAAVGPDHNDGNDGDEGEPSDEWMAEHARVLRHAVSLDWPFPGGGTLDYLSPGRQDRTYARRVSTFDWDSFFDRLDGATFLGYLRADLLRHYDYVLVDSPTGIGGAAAICTVELPDIVLDCFALSTQSIDGAAALAWSIESQRLNQPVRVLPVPMRVEEADQGKLDAARGYARLTFETFVSALAPERADEYWREVEIPYKTFYAYEEILAPFGDLPQQHNSLLAAYERLTGMVTDGRVGRTPVVPEPDRRRVLGEFERGRSPVPADVLVTYASVDLMWAEWIAAELADSGLAVELLAIDATSWAEAEEQLGRTRRIMVLLSHDFTRAPDAQTVWKAAGQLGSGPRRLLLPVRLDSVRLTAPFNERRPIDLAALTEERARGELREAFDLRVPPAGPAAPDGPRRPRYPSSPPPVLSVPPRNPAFTGRDRALAEVRAGLAAPHAAPRVLCGSSGVGKSQLALEYAHRFAAYYDVVWWISASQPSTARAGLYELAGALGLSREGQTNAVRAVLDALSTDPGLGRWLLIYDDADHPDDIRDLIAVDALPAGRGDPGTAGHTLVTTRNPAWGGPAYAPVELGVFDRAESIAFLRRLVQPLTEDEADLLAENVGDLPLALEQAAAWLTATSMDVRRYVDELDRVPAEMLDQYQAVGYPRTATATWQLALRRMREQAPAAARALEVLAFLAPAPIPLSLLSQDRFLAVLTPLDESLRLPVMVGRLTREIVRFGLARVDHGRDSIVIPRLVQAIIRGQLTPEQTEDARTRAFDVLAAANPVITDDPNRWPAFDELWPHLRIPGLLAADAREVRQLIIDMVRYRYRRYDFTSSAELAEAALSQWLPRFGEDDLLALHLRFHLANAFRAEARFTESLALDEDVLVRLTRIAGPDHPYTLMVAGGLAADYRALGEFAVARDLDLDTAARYRDAFGEDHYRALMAANNLAVSLRMVGDYQAAADLDLDTWTRRRTSMGDRHPYTLFSANNYGGDLREIGDLTGSRALLESTLRAYREVIGEDRTDTLRTARSLAATLRRLGEFTAAHELATDTLERYEQVHGADHPDTLLCEITVASTFAGIGDPGRARSLAMSTMDKIVRVLGEVHILSTVCRHNLAVFELKLGNAEAALPLAASVLARFGELLGAEHPHTLIAAQTVASIRWAVGDRAGARELDEATYPRLGDALGDDHPETLAATVNLVISRAGADRSFDRFMADRLATFADRYPWLRTTRPGERVIRHIDPPSP
jgi:hypothetical protein